MKKGAIWKNIILITSVWVVVIVATLAWFYFGTTANVNDLPVAVGDASYVQISGDGGGNWSDDLDIEFGVQQELKEMSGDGSRFYTPVYEVVRNQSGELVSQIAAFEEVKDNAFYYEYVFDFRSDGDNDLYLAPQSYVAPVNDTDEAYIAGAIRVAFYELDDDGSETLKYIWAPNSKIEFSREDGTFTTDGTPEEYYYYQVTKDPGNVDYQSGGNPNVVAVPTHGGSGECGGCGYNADHKFMWSCGEDMPEDAPPLVSLRLNGDTVAQKRMKVKVWLEGYDRECVSQINGQRFTMRFQFNAEKENNDE